MDKIGLQYKIECANHKSNYLEAISISQSLQGQQLKCIECIQDENISPNLFIPISKIENSNDQTILSNWPPLSEGLLKRLNNQNKEQNDHLSKTKENVIKFFQEFKEEILHVLSQKEKEALQILEKHSENIHKNVIVYNQIAGKDKLKDILHGYQSNSKQADQLLGKFIQQKHLEKQQNSLLLDEALNESALNQLIFNDYQNSRQDIMKDIQKLTIVNCTKQMPKEVNLQKNLQTLPKQHQQHNAYEQSKLQSTQQLNKDSQLLQNQILSRRQSGLQQQNNLLSEQHTQLPNQIKQQQNNEKDKIQDQKRKSILAEQFCQQLGISELNQQKHDQQNLNRRRINFDMINSRFEQSEYGTIKKKDRGEIVIKNLYNDIIIEKDKRYILEIDIRNASQSGEQYIGLIKDSIKNDQHLSKSGICFLPMEDIWIDSYTSIIQGQRIRHFQYAELISIQILVHLKDRFFQLSDLPHRANILQSKPENIDLNETYRLGTHLCKQNDRIVIKNIFIVNSFDNK